MTQKDLVGAVAGSLKEQDVAATKSLITKVVETALEQIMDTLSNGEDVKLNDFGQFKINQRAARVGRNPATGESVIIAAKNVVAFRPAKKLKELL